MSRTVSGARDRRAEEAAYLLAEQKLKPTQIAQKLNTSESNVSKLLKRAIEMGCLVVREPEFNTDGVEQGRLEELRDLVKTRSLTDQLRKTDSSTGVQVRKVRVVGLVKGSAETREHQSEVAGFGRAAAARVAQLIRRSTIFLVTWGKTLSVIVDGLDAAQLEGTRSDLRFVPVCAEPEQFSGSRESSSVISDRLNALAKSDPNNRLWLTRIPAFIPRDLTPDMRAGIVHLIRHSHSYSRIFDADPGTPPGPHALVSKADALLTSVGHADHPMGFNYDELLKLGDITPDALRGLVVGDIGGVLIHRDQADRNTVDSLNQMWTGCQYDTLAQIAIRANDNGTPGIIVASYGTHRAEILEAVIRRGLVNELIVDETAAIALRQRLATRSNERS